MENTSDSFMPRPLLFCLKSERSVCYSVPDNTQTKALQYAITKEQIIHRQTYLMDDLDELCNKKFDF